MCISSLSSQSIKSSDHFYGRVGRKLCGYCLVTWERVGRSIDLGHVTSCDPQAQFRKKEKTREEKLTVACMQWAWHSKFQHTHMQGGNVSAVVLSVRQRHKHAVLARSRSPSPVTCLVPAGWSCTGSGDLRAAWALLNVVFARTYSVGVLASKGRYGTGDLHSGNWSVLSGEMKQVDRSRPNPPNFFSCLTLEPYGGVSGNLRPSKMKGKKSCFIGLLFEISL